MLVYVAMDIPYSFDIITFFKGIVSVNTVSALTAITITIDKFISHS